MSYANDVCSNRFSDEQTLALRANLLDVRQSWLAPASPAYPALAGAPVLRAPINGAAAPALGALLQWEKLPGATHYVVQASRFSNFTVRELEGVTSDTFFTCGQLAVNKFYYWRVRPFNPIAGCTEFSASGQFFTGLSSAPTAETASDWRCYPALLSPGQALTLELPAHWVDQKIQCRVYDFNGRMVWLDEINATSDQIRLEDFAASLPGGAYRIVAQTAADIRSQSLMVARF
jgi:hypothetical protein